MKGTVSLLVGICISIIAALILGYMGEGLGGASARIALAMGVAGGLLAWFSIPDSAIPKARLPRSWAAWSVLVIFALFSLRAFCWVVYFKDGEIAFLSPNNLGDLSLHFTFTRYFANGVPFWPDNPIYSAAALHYPFGMDLFNALLLLMGVDLIRGFVWAGLIGALATGIMLWRWGGAFAIAGFLFNGGFAAWKIFSDGNLDDFQSQLAWKSIPLALFVTQRGLLYAIPAGLALLWSWRARLFRGERGLPVWIEVLLYSTMPIFHLHTFLFLSAMLGGWFALSFWGPVWRMGLPSAFRQKTLRIVGWSVAPATVLIWLLTGGFQSGNTIHLKPGWMQEEQNPFVFWFENFGVMPLCIVALFVWFWRRRTAPGELPKLAEQSAIVIPAVAVFLIGCFVMFAPWEWDNTKLFLWSYLTVLPVLWAMLRLARPWLRGATCFALFFSGAVALVGGLDGRHQGYTLARRSELDGLKAHLDALPSTATFACVPTYNHPLLLLGRKVVAGYEGHLSSHGIDYMKNKIDLETLLRGEPGWEDRAQKLGVDYLFWGSLEEKRFGSSPAPWTEQAELIAQGEWGKIYDLRPFVIKREGLRDR